jgi:membrane protein YdbS with pleckstrin-like domain
VSVESPLGDVVHEQWLHPSPKLGALRHCEALAGTVIVLLAIGLPLLLTGQQLAAGIAAAAVIAAGAVTDVLLLRRVAAWAFCERADDLLVRRGLMVRRLSLVPYGRMQFVDVSAGPLERSFGLATLRLHTAAAASDARIPGLPRAEADRLRDQLSTLGGSRMAGL